MIGKDPTEGLHMEVSFCGINFQNPVMTCSGTFGSGAEYGEFVNLSRLGAVVTKGVSRDPWEGNPTPRLAETPSGMLNAIGLQNPGIDTFVSRDLPFLAQAGTKVIVNVCGHSVGEYKDVVERLPQCQTGGHCLRDRPQAGREGHPGSESGFKKAHHHEAFAQCHVDSRHGACL